MLTILGKEELKKANSDYEWTTTDDFSTNYDIEMELNRWKAIAKATAKGILEWGDEECPHVSHKRARHWCGECWEEFEEAVK